MSTFFECSSLINAPHKKYRFFFFILFIFSSENLKAEYEATGAGEVVDSNFFGGLTKEQLEKKMQGAYQQAIQENFKQFRDKGKENGSLYDAYGRNHQGVNYISEHSINGAEKVNIKGALGNDNLSPAEIIRKNKEIMDSYCVKTNTNPNNPQECRNKFTGQIQEKNFNISAAVYDAGPAHGNDPNDPHRVYGIIESVRDENKKFGERYGDKIIKEATKPGENTNLEMLEIARLQLEQQKYVHMVAMFFALRSSNLAGNSFAADEFKQLAINIFAKNKGNIKKAENEIKQELAKRIAEHRVLGSTNLCDNNRFQRDSICSTSTTSGTSSGLNISNMASAVLAKLGVSQGPEALAKMQEKLKEKIYKQRDRSGNPDSNETHDLRDVFNQLSLSDLSGIIDDEGLKNLYASAEPTDAQKRQMSEYLTQLPKCLEFNKFCYTGFGPTANLQRDSNQEVILFQELRGDPGDYFKDTRELQYANFAYAANRPLSETERIVTNADFNSNTDAKLRTGYNRNPKDLKPYEEFQKNYQITMKAVKGLQDYDDEVRERYRKAGATQADLDSLKPNYSVKVDPSTNRFMEVFGGMKEGRDAVLSSWRTNPNSFVDPNEKKGTALIKARAPASAGQVSLPSSPRVSVPKKPRVN
jgi:hypothetical protein